VSADGYAPALSGAPANDPGTTELATFAGGCFWCIEAVFLLLRGVHRVESGYTGGRRPNPTYEQVCTGATGHAEVIRIAFDPRVISYRQLLEVFFTVHDPTTLNRQGADVGTQYRSEVFAHSEDQARVAREVIAEFDRGRVWGAPIVTAVSLIGAYYPAEQYHQNYYARNPQNAYCSVTIEPKVAKLRKKFLDLLADA
jgi:peptide-methionine (S)-S-oxide reductase